MTDVSEETTAAGVGMLASLGINLNPQSEAVDEVEDDLSDLVVEQVTATLASPPEFSVPRAVLQSMVDQAMLVVPTRDFVPALKNLVIDVTDSRMTITGSDSTSTVVTSTTAVRVVKPGRVLIGAAKFSNVIRRAGGPEVKLRAEEQLLGIESGRSSWSLRIAGVQDYVQLADVGDLSWTVVDRHAFVRAVGATRYAAGSDENDPGRMQLDISGGLVTTTDKFSFAQASGMLPEDLHCELSTAAVDLLLKMLDRNDAEEFRLADTEFHTIAEIGPAASPDRMVVAHITEAFPAEAKNAITTPLVENRDELTLDGDELTEALRRAAPTSDEETLAVALKVGSPDPESVTVATRNRYGDVSSEQITATFRRLGSDNVPAARTVLLNHQRLAQAVRAAGLARKGAIDSDSSGAVRLLLGVDRSRSRPAFVVVQDGIPEGEEGAGSVRAVLTQVRSDWMT